MITFMNNKTSDAIRLTLIKHKTIVDENKNVAIELRHERWNSETLRFETTLREFHFDANRLRLVLRAKLNFIKTKLTDFHEKTM